MPGLPIPDDWDGNTYKCYKIHWPKSEQFEAILLGQLSEPQVPAYWTPGSGDPQDVETALLHAEGLTLPTFYTEDCDQVISEPIPTFKAVMASNQVLPDGSWHKCVLDGTPTWNVNGTGWQQGFQEHQPSTVGKNNGLWVYKFAMQLSGPPKDVGVRGRFGGSVIGSDRSEGGRVSLAFDHLWVDDINSIYIEIFATGGGTVLAGPQFTWLAGFYAGDRE